MARPIARDTAQIAATKDQLQSLKLRIDLNKKVAYIGDFIRAQQEARKVKKRAEARAHAIPNGASPSTLRLLLEKISS